VAAVPLVGTRGRPTGQAGHGACSDRPGVQHGGGLTHQAWEARLTEFSGQATYLLRKAGAVSCGESARWTWWW